jgi:NDP-sugar pyrophosphorylase family protein
MSTPDIDAVILAGGLGTRLRSVVADVPKPLAPVNGEPFLNQLLRSLEPAGRIRKVVLALGYMAEKAAAYYEQNAGFAFSLDFSVETTPLGTGGAIKQALARTTSPVVLALNGDSFIEFSLSGLIAAHTSGHADFTMVLKELDDPSRFGTVRLDNAGRVMSFAEKQDQSGRGFINAGVYLFARDLFAACPGDRAVSLEKELLPGFIGKHSVQAFITQGKFIDIGLPETYNVSGQFFSGG